MQFPLSLALAAACCCSVQQLLAQPEKITPVNSTESGTCGSIQNNIRNDEINVLIRDRVNPTLNDRYGPPCSCSAGIEWIKVANLDMNDINQGCPSNWQLVNTNSIRGCGKPEGSVCRSAIFQSPGTYSRVCGRIIAVQRGSPDGFGPSIYGSNPGIEGGYVDGVSLTHGAPGSRQHIWTFVANVYETGSEIPAKCSCTNVNENWPYTVPSFIGENYFCDSAIRGTTFQSSYYPDDPLWDGQGCGPTSTCCQFQNPPWFCTKLPTSTSDDLEVRICADGGVADEDTVVTRVEIYVK